MNAQNIRFILRDRTSSAHALVDSRAGTFADRASYVRYLQGIHVFRSSSEAALADMNWPADFGAWRPMRVAGLIAQDLADLQACPLPARSRDPLPIEDRESLLGTLYVLEGSSIGARVLNKRARDIGMSESFGARHLGMLAADTQSWPGFLRILEGSASLDLEKLVKASKDTFDLALRAFDGEEKCP